MSKLETARQLARQTLEQEKDSEMEFREQVQESLNILKKNQVAIYNREKNSMQKLQEQGDSLNSTLERLQVLLTAISDNQIKWRNRFLLLLIMLGILLITAIIRMV